MKKLICFTFNVRKWQRINMATPNVENVAEAASAGPEKKTLAEVMQEAKDVLKTAEESLKKVKDYYGIKEKYVGKTVQILDTARTLPDDVKKAYIAFYDRYIDLKIVVIELPKKVEGGYHGSGSQRVFRTEQEVYENTLERIYDVFGTLTAVNEKVQSEEDKKYAERDPMNSKLGNTRLELSPLEPAAAPEVHPGQMEENTPEKGQKPKTPEELMNERSGEVIRKIIEISKGSTSEKLTVPEIMAIVTLMEAGKSKTIPYADAEGKSQNYILERDVTGYYVRIRGYNTAAVREEGGIASEDLQDPFISLRPDIKKEPIWPQTNRVEVADAETEKNKEDFKKQMEWLMRANTPPGSKVTFGYLRKTEKIDDNQERLTRFDFEVVKQVDGAFRITTNERVAIRKTIEVDGKKVTNVSPDPSVPEQKITRTYDNRDDVLTLANAMITSKSGINNVTASPAEQEAEGKLGEQIKYAWLEKTGGNLMRLFVSGVGTESFQSTMAKMQAYAEKNNITDWKSTEQFAGLNVVIKNGSLELQRENKNYLPGTEGLQPYEVAYQRPLTHKKSGKNQQVA